MMHPVYSQVLDFIKRGDHEGLKQYLNSEMDLHDLLVIKCETCGEVLGGRPLSEALPKAFAGGDTFIGYVVLKHLQHNRDHMIMLQGWPGDLNLSQMFLGALQTACKLHNMTLDEGFEQRIPYLEEKLRK